MDSPEKDHKRVIASTSSDSAPVQDSPIFSYISNLSPIKPVKTAPVAQGFPGLSSPPLVFTSPRINVHQQSLEYKRPQCPLSSHAQLSGQDAIGKNVPSGSDETEKSTSRISSDLNTRVDKDHGNENSAHDQAGSSSGCIDEYLADISEMGCGDSTQLANSSLKQSQDVPSKMAESINLKGSIERVGNKDDKQNVVMAPGASPAVFEQAEEDHQGYLTSHVKPVEKDGESSKVVSDLSVDHAFDEQHYEQPMTELIQEYKDCGQTIEAVILNKPVVNTMLEDSKVNQSQLCKRRRLKFEEAQHNIIANDPCSWNPSNGANCSRSPVSPSNSEVPDSSCVDIPATPSNMQLGSMTPSTHSLFSPQNNKNSSLIVSKPSGIGLHLNSIVNAMPLACVSTAITKSTEGSYLSARGKKFISVGTSHLSDSTKYHSNSSNTNLGENVLVRTEGSEYEAPASFRSSDSAKPLKLNEYQAITYDQGKANSRQAEFVDEFNRLSPRKKRKKTENSGDGDGDGCKRCNCKKTKCLKLYCDCFAAGIYCAEPCACQGCFNRPEYEDTVSETRQQIESRNPFAFAPKIIRTHIQPPASHSGGNGDRLTPLSGRHKRGCNCKKSMCLKKYCECYQANVGCSDGCRCEGCKNFYGKKGEYGMSREVGSTEAINENWDDSFDEKLKMLAARKSAFLPEFHNPHNLTPQTPSFQYSDHGKDAPKAQFLSGRYLPSPQSSCTFFPPYAGSPKSPGDSSNCEMTLETSKDILNVVSFDQESNTNAEVVGEFSPGYHAFGNTGHLTALTNNPPTMEPASLGLQKTRDWTNRSRAQLSSGSGHLSSVSSLRWRSSPITPVDPFSHQVMDSENRLNDIMEDETPEILKDSSTSHNTVKVSSPNKKRVSPPKNHMHHFGSSSLKSGRKFILQSISSFPPLTPCIDFKDGNIQDANE